MLKKWSPKRLHFVSASGKLGRYEIGYITLGAPGKIRLEKGRWYTAAGAGNLTIGPVRVRIE